MADSQWNGFDTGKRIREEWNDGGTVYKVDDSYSNLLDRLKSLEARVDELEKRRRRSGRDCDEKAEIRRSLNNFLDYMESEGVGREYYIGKSSHTTFGFAMYWCKTNGAVVDDTRGNKTIMTHLVCKRYDLETVGGYFREKAVAA